MNTNHIDQDWFNRTVRQTEDGKASVLDLIKQATSGRSERTVWKRLKEQHPELDGLCDGVRFCDANGRLHKDATPVVDLEGWLQILPLLPGVAGKKYRKQTAELIVRIWKGDADLGLAIMLRDINKDRAERAKNRLRCTDINNLVTETSLEINERPDLVHNARYQGLYLMNAKTVRKKMGITESPLNYMDASDLAMHEVIGHIGVKAQQAHGGKLQEKIHSAARNIRNVFEKQVGSPPELPDPIKVGYMDPADARAISACADAGQIEIFS